jgi:hypothetical protein
MAIKAVIDKLEDVAEPFRELYTERNGKFELTGVEGMKTEADVTRLTSALEKERNDHKGTKKKFEIFGDRKPEDILASLDRIPELEAAAAGKLDDNAINKIVETRIGSKTGPLERTIAQLRKDVADRDGLIQGFQAKETQRTLHDAIRDAFGKSQGIQSAALEDALMLGERMLEINEDGKVVTKDNVGVTPGIDATVWLTEMQQKRPHWWGPTGGGGAGGSGGRGGASGGKNPWSAEHWNVTEQGKLYKQNPTQADQMARSAGTTIGGLRPPVRK